MQKKVRMILISIAIVLAAFSIVVAGLLVYFSYWDNFPKNDQQILGASFSAEHATDLGLDYRQVFTKVLDGWKFGHIRLAAQWDEVEAVQGKYNFSSLDWLMNEANKRGAKIVLALGHKTPRWPECHLPKWALALHENEAQYNQAALNYVSKVVGRYKNHPALEIWQVENEPFLKFGECPPFSMETFNEEIALVKKLDPQHPLMVSDSGELSSWRKTANKLDLFGSTLYRVVWHPVLGYFNYDWLPPAFYRAKLKLNKRSLETTYIMELQAEPWLPNGSVLNTPTNEQYKSMNLERLKKHLDFSARVGTSRAYLWGAEWWYWLERQGQTKIPEFISSLDKGRN
jgi:hypothetical protein